jgi:hypothetical protein
MRTLKLEAGVSELDAGRLKIGAAAKVTLSARPGETFDGPWRPLARSGSPGSAFPRRDPRGQPGEALLGGMFATARVVVAGPTAWLRREAVADRGGGRVVHRPTATPCGSFASSSPSDGSKVARLGREAGDLIVSDARRDVTDGAHVRQSRRTKFSFFGRSPCGFRIRQSSVPFSRRCSS